MAPRQEQANTLWVQQAFGTQEGKDTMAEHESSGLAIDVGDRHPVPGRVPAAAGDERVNMWVPSQVVAERLPLPGAAALIISRAV